NQGAVSERGSPPLARPVRECHRHAGRRAGRDRRPDDHSAKRAAGPVRVCRQRRQHRGAQASEGVPGRGRRDGRQERGGPGRDRRNRGPAAARARRPGHRPPRPGGEGAMNLAKGFIEAPVPPPLIILGITIFGVMAYRVLPVSDLPNVDFPTIQVSAGLPGASPETMASSVATPLEKPFSTIAGLDNMSSSSTQGSTSITLQFNLSRDLDGAALDVQSAISAAGRPLPPPRRPAPHPGARPPAAPEHAGAALLRQGQPGGPARPLPDADLEGAPSV